MLPRPIRIIADNPTDGLSPLARLNFGKIYTVEHNIKVKNFGMVHEGSVQDLIRQFTTVWFGQINIGSSRTHAQSARSESDQATVRGSSTAKAASQASVPSTSGKRAFSSGNDRDVLDDVEQEEEDDGESTEDEGDDVTRRTALVSSRRPTSRPEREWSSASDAWQTRLDRLIRDGNTREQAIRAMAQSIQRQRPRMARSEAHQMVLQLLKERAPTQEDSDPEDSDPE